MPRLGQIERIEVEQKNYWPPEIPVPEKEE
jgi:hypothetical protein